MKTYEVCIIYKGQRNYIVQAVDEDKANVLAMNRYHAGDNGDDTGSEYEEVENIVTREVPC